MLANGGWDLTLTLLTWTKWRAPTNASKWRMGFNSAFKGLTWNGANSWTLKIGPIGCTETSEWNYTHTLRNIKKSADFKEKVYISTCLVTTSTANPATDPLWNTPTRPQGRLKLHLRHANLFGKCLDYNTDWRVENLHFCKTHNHRLRFVWDAVCV